MNEWAMLVAWTLHAYPDLAAKELPEIVAHMFVAIRDNAILHSRSVLSWTHGLP